MYVHPNTTPCPAYDLPYSSGPKEVNLAIVENHIRPGPNVLKVMDAESGHAADLPRYPGNKQAEPRIGLEASLRKLHSIGPELSILLTHGSDSALRAILNSFASTASPGRVAFPIPTYPHFLEFTKQIPTGALKLHPLDVGREEDVVECLEKSLAVAVVDMVYLVNPSLPFGHVFDLERFRALAVRNPQTLFVVDEAYVHFQSDPELSAMNLAENVLVVRTFSKAYALAAARLGWMVGQPSTLRVIDRFINQKDVSDYSCRLGKAAIDDHEYYMSAAAEVMTTSRADLLQIPGVCFGPGGNFGLLTLPKDTDPATFVENLRKHGFLLRDKSKEIPQTLRFTVPPPHVAKDLVKSLGKLLTLDDKTIV